MCAVCAGSSGGGAGGSSGRARGKKAAGKSKNSSGSGAGAGAGKMTQNDVRRQQKKNKNDVFATPPELCKMHIEHVRDIIAKYNIDDRTWLEPFRFSGNYYDQFPAHVQKEWTELFDGRSFWQYQGKPNVICTNPPFSCLGSQE